MLGAAGTKRRSAFEAKYLERFGTAANRGTLSVGLSPQLIQKQEELERTNEQLEEARSRYESWRMAFERKQKEVDEKKAQLEAQRRHLDAFTAQQQAALEKARRREAEEIEQARAIDGKLKELLAEEEQLREENEALRRELDELQPCADYLQAVVDANPVFESREAILNRHAGLVATRSEYLQRCEELMRRFGSEESELVAELQSIRAHLIETTMRYHAAVVRGQQVRHVNEHKRASLVKDLQRIESKRAELASIKTAISAIYKRAKEGAVGGKRVGAADRKSELTEEQMLEYIESRFEDLREIVQ